MVLFQATKRLEVRWDLNLGFHMSPGARAKISSPLKTVCTRKLFTKSCLNEKESLNEELKLAPGTTARVWLFCLENA
jgi:hypothetical protein